MPVADGRPVLQLLCLSQRHDQRRMLRKQCIHWEQQLRRVMLFCKFQNLLHRNGLLQREAPGPRAPQTGHTPTAAKALPDCCFSFYGRIDTAYEAKFASELERLPNAEYRGVFDSVAGDVVKELNQYDVHLFPTMCPHEGVPGVIAETKLAGVPTIASNRGYNGELIEDGVDGLLTKQDSATELIDAISALSDNPTQLDGMKRAALDSAVKFYVDRYLDLIVSELPQEGGAQ